MNKTLENFLKTTFKENEEKKGIELKISVTDTVNLLLCFVMAHCSLFSGMMPLGAAAYAAVFASDRWFMYLAAALLGLFQNRPDLTAVPYTCAMIAATVFMGLLRPASKVRYRAIVMSLCLFAALVCTNIITGFYLFDVFMAAVEAAVCFGAVYIFYTAIPVLINGNERHYLSDVEAVSVITVFALLVRCMSYIPLVFGINPAVVAAIVLLLVINLEGEIASGAAMGVILGVVCGGNTESIASATGAFAISSLCSGLMKRYGKLGVILGFIVANAAMTAFLKSELLPFDIFEVIIASGIFVLLPKRVINYVSSFPAKTVHTANDAFVSRDKLQKVICERLDRLAGSFAELSCSYSRCFENQSMSQQYIIHMLDTASSKICPDCGLKYSCWERGYKTSYAAMLDMLKKAEEKGCLSASDVPEPFASKCKKIHEFTQSFNRMFEVYRVEKMWQKRLNDSRMLVSGQLKGVSRTIENLANEFDMCLDVPAEKQLKTALDREGIKADDITVMRGRGSDFSADIYFNRGRCSKKDEQKISEIITELTGVSTYAARSFYVENSLVITYKPQCDYGVSTGVASTCRNGEEVCGDSYTICENSFGETVIAISDGMGTGSAAARESTAAAELLRDFSDAGMNVETSLELINSSLLLRSSGENFATMDVCTVRCSDGVISFSKSGAAPSYVKNEYGISKIESNALPFGVMEQQSEINTEVFTVENSAVVLMVSDGVSDDFVSEEEDGLIKKLETLETVNPQVVASVILNTAIELSGGKADDDMTVIAISIWKN